MLLATKMDTRFDTVQKLVAYGKQNPGKLNFGSIAVGSTQNLSAELFKMVTGVNAAVVTFRTTPELMTAIERGDVDVGFDYYAAFSPMVAGKQIKIIATSGDKPSPLFTGVPTVKDSAIRTMSSPAGTRCLSAPARRPTSSPSSTARSAPFCKCPRSENKMADLGMEPLASTPEALTQRLKADADEMARGHRQSRHPETVIGR